jgi:hypothetical protein
MAEGYMQPQEECMEAAEACIDELRVGVSAGRCLGHDQQVNVQPRAPQGYLRRVACWSNVVSVGGVGWCCRLCVFVSVSGVIGLMMAYIRIKRGDRGSDVGRLTVDVKFRENDDNPLQSHGTHLPTYRSRDLIASELMSLSP